MLLHSPSVITMTVVIKLCSSHGKWTRYTEANMSNQDCPASDIHLSTEEEKEQSRSERTVTAHVPWRDRAALSPRSCCTSQNQKDQGNVPYLSSKFPTSCPGQYPSNPNPYPTSFYNVTQWIPPSISPSFSTQGLFSSFSPVALYWHLCL